MTAPMTNAEQVLTLARSRPPTLGGARLVCVDGPAGSGKTTLAAELATLAGGAAVVHMDDLYEGWGGLGRVEDQLQTLLRPLAEGFSGSYRRWDWPGNAWAETVLVPPAPLLVLEGVGSGSTAHADLTTVLAWVEVPFELRMARGLERDGDAAADHWRQWARDERDLFTRERTRERADVVLDGRVGSLHA
ncbi:MAG TPA: 4-amino-4-deoxy-L-arabinose transferase [Nocardioides sp.]|uniref:uridine kinase family protein n=1 Tax=Nocardioides sp. TaxID=35761 RepID=UPI002F3FC92C